MTKSQDHIELEQLVRAWDKSTLNDPRDTFNYTAKLRELLFHADLRFGQYIQFEEDGPYITRFRNWLYNSNREEEQKALFKLASLIDFIDEGQMYSLYRDAYKRIIVPYVSSGFSREDLIDSNFEMNVRAALNKYRFYSITQSFKSSEFINKNSLAGINKIDMLGEVPSTAIKRIPDISAPIEGLIILEDFVGTGKQSSKVIAKVKSVRPTWKILFVPLIILYDGYSAMTSNKELSEVMIEPALIIEKNSCLSDIPAAQEPEELAYVRTIVKTTSGRVLQKLNVHDDPPKNAFGFKKSGSLLVTHHNTPNNTLPLIHHRAPNWVPLFRRVHHSKDGL